MELIPEKKRHRDINQRAKLIVDIVIGEAEDITERLKDSRAIKNGSDGGKIRADNLTPERRKEIAKKAAKARWKKD